MRRSHSPRSSQAGIRARLPASNTETATGSCLSPAKCPHLASGSLSWSNGGQGPSCPPFPEVITSSKVRFTACGWIHRRDVQRRSQFGTVSGELRVTGRMGNIRVTNVITLYAQLDRVDFECHLEKPPTTNEQRLLHFFPIGDGARDLHLETTAAVLRPQPQPDGDLLPGADSRRFAVQGFVDHSPPGRVGVTVAPLDAFMLRLDQGELAFEALGNDQNWKEVTQDQDGVRHFRFRYSLRAHAPGYDNAAALAWSRSVQAPLTAASGRLPKKWLNRPGLEVDPARALVTCLKPLDAATANQVLARVWETSGASGPLTLIAPGFRHATETDLLERERGPLRLTQDRVSLNARGHGFSAVKLDH